jgi:hypothetical protein
MSRRQHKERGMLKMRLEVPGDARVEVKNIVFGEGWFGVHVVIGF